MVCVCKAAPVAEPHKEPKKEVRADPNKPFIETLPDGVRIKHVGNRRYKLVRRPVQYKDGTFGEEDIEMDVTPRPKAPGARPYPSEAEVAARAEAEASKNLGGASNLIKAAVAVSQAQQLQKEDNEHTS
jgi:hypothetical protein